MPRCPRDDRSALVEDRQAFLDSIVSDPSRSQTPVASGQLDNDPKAQDEQRRAREWSSGGGHSLAPFEGERTNMSHLGRRLDICAGGNSKMGPV